MATVDLAQGPREAAERLLKRLSSDISVVLAGPEVDAKEYLFDVLAQAALSQTSLRVVPWRDPLDYATADICIWCTVGFELDEATQWQAAPDRLKDHSFLVAFSETTPFDAKLDQGDLDRLGGIAAEEFYALSHVAFGNRATTSQPDTVKALVQEVAKKVRMGAAADADNAQLFIQTYQVKDSPPAEVKSAQEPLADPALMQTPSPTAATSTAATSVFESALGMMNTHIADLEPLLNAQEEADFQKILAICEATMSATVEVLEQGNLTDPELALITEDTLSASDTILLMSTEGGTAPVLSAVHMVLQLRREVALQVAC